MFGELQQITICTSSLNASVVAETVQKILDVTMFLDKRLSAARYFGMEPQENGSHYDLLIICRKNLRRKRIIMN